MTSGPRHHTMHAMFGTHCDAVIRTTNLHVATADANTIDLHNFHQQPQEYMGSDSYAPVRADSSSLGTLRSDNHKR